MLDSITVITLTRQRPDLLKRAMLSVETQDYAGDVTHLVIVDDCDETHRKFQASSHNSNNHLTVYFAPRSDGDVSGQARSAFLRNLGIRKSTSRWIAFLDDDNEYDSNHLSSLIACAERNSATAVHSHRKIFRADGMPYLEPRFPWVRDPAESIELFEYFCSKGVLAVGSNVMRDRAETIDSPDAVRVIDTSVWLLERNLLLRFPIPEDYTTEELSRNVCEDDKLLALLLLNKIPIYSTGLATLRYYLGGYSNNFAVKEI